MARHVRSAGPGCDVHLSVSQGFLTIRAERKEETQTKHRTEFRYGMFERSVQLPGAADGDKVSAHYKDGILEVTVPLRAQPEPKKIAITKQ